MQAILDTRALTKPPRFSGRNVRSDASLCSSIEPLMMQSRNLLVQLVGGRALTIPRAIPDQHGFEAWRRLTLQLEPAIATRTVGMLQSLLTPAFRTDSLMNLETDYLQWEADVHRYQRESPNAIAPQLQMHAAGYESDYKKLREALRTFLESSRRWGANVLTSSTSTAMPGDSTSME
eukprot:5101790-Amphidinium_carterae.1